MARAGQGRNLPRDASACDGSLALFPLTIEGGYPTSSQNNQHLLEPENSTIDSSFISYTLLANLSRLFMALRLPCPPIKFTTICRASKMNPHLPQEMICRIIEILVELDLKTATRLRSVCSESILDRRPSTRKVKKMVQQDLQEIRCHPGV